MWLLRRMYHQATVAAVLSRSWRVRKRAHQTIRKLLSSLGGCSLANGLLAELCVVINKHKVQTDHSPPNDRARSLTVDWGWLYPLFSQPDCCWLCDSQLSGFAPGRPGVRLWRADWDRSQLRSPSCPVGRARRSLLLRRPLERPHWSREFGHGDPHSHSSSILRYDFPSRLNLLTAW